MSKTTGPILAMGAITMANQNVFNDKSVDWRIPIATGLLAVGFTMAERVWPKGVQILAWTGVVAVVLTRTQSSIPSPAESALQWWNKGQTPGGGTLKT
jgi:multisubunit Na+/H+ antiporter MnhB subunit